MAPPLTLADRPAAAAGSLSLFDSDVEFDGIGYVGVSAGLRYRF